jgi:hypothetical protein
LQACLFRRHSCRSGHLQQMCQRRCHRRCHCQNQDHSRKRPRPRRTRPHLCPRPRLRPRHRRPRQRRLRLPRRHPHRCLTRLDLWRMCPLPHPCYLRPNQSRPCPIQRRPRLRRRRPQTPHCLLLQQLVARVEALQEVQTAPSCWAPRRSPTGLSQPCLSKHHWAPSDHPRLSRRPQKKSNCQGHQRPCQTHLRKRRPPPLPTHRRRWTASPRPQRPRHLHLCPTHPRWCPRRPDLWRTCLFQHQ